MRENILITVASFLTTLGLIFISLVLLFVFWKYVQSSNSPYEVMTPEYHHAEPLNKGTIVIHRQFRITRPVKLYISRELYSVRTDGILTRIELPQTTVEYQRGEYAARRIVEIPIGLEGRFEFRSTLCWDVNPIRKDCINLPVLSLLIK